MSDKKDLFKAIHHDHKIIKDLVHKYTEADSCTSQSTNADQSFVDGGRVVEEKRKFANAFIRDLSVHSVAEELSV